LTTAVAVVAGHSPQQRERVVALVLVQDQTAQTTALVHQLQIVVQAVVVAVTSRLVVMVRPVSLLSVLSYQPASQTQP